MKLLRLSYDQEEYFFLVGDKAVISCMKIVAERREILDTCCVADGDIIRKFAPTKRGVFLDWIPKEKFIL